MYLENSTGGTDCFLLEAKCCKKFWELGLWIILGNRNIFSGNPIQCFQSLDNLKWNSIYLHNRGGARKTAADTLKLGKTVHIPLGVSWDNMCFSDLGELTL